VNPLNVPTVNASATGIAWIFLLTLTMPGLTPLLVCNNNEPFVSRGQTFQPFPFKITLPSDDSDTLPKVSLEIANVSGEIIEFIRTSKFAPKVVVELVTSAYPDIVEKQLNFLKLTSVTYDAMTVSGSLDMDNFLSQKFPVEGYTPIPFPAIFR
jgi:hypothetical protein